MTSLLSQKCFKLLQFPYKFLPKPICNLIWDISLINDSLAAIVYRRLYLSKYAKSVGTNTHIGKYIVLKNVQNLVLGNNVSLHSYCYIDAHGGIDIGSNVSIANHCTLISSEHTWGDKDKPIKYNKIQSKRICIEDDVWIAAGVRVLGGNTIKTRCIIGAGAVVNKDTEPNSLYVGVPIKKIREVNK